VVLDDATSEIYYAPLVGEESTRTVMAALREVVESKGVFCSLYSDRGSHFFLTPKAGEAVDKTRLTQVGRAMRELNIEMIPAYSPQARGRSERNFGTWQNRLPQELRLRDIGRIEEANRFLREHYISESNRMFAKPAREKGTAFRKCDRKNLDQVFSIQTERIVAKDNTIAIRDRRWQLDRSPFRHTLADCRVTVCEHLNGTISVRWGPHVVGRFDAQGSPLEDQPAKRRTEAEPKRPACGSKEVDRPFPVSPPGKAGAGGFPPRREPAARQQKALARIDAAGSPHKRAAAPLCIPRSAARTLGRQTGWTV